MYIVNYYGVTDNKMFLISVAVYYLRAQAEASKQMVHILREMLVWQARDKEFLLKSFTKVTNESS